MPKIHHMALMRAKSKFSSSRAAWAAVAKSTGLKPSQVTSTHTAKAYRWELKNKSKQATKPVKRTKTGVRKKPSKARPAKKATTKKQPAAKRAEKMTVSQARGLSLILGVADKHVCSSGKLCHASGFYKRLSTQGRIDFDAGRALLRKRTK